MATSKQEIKDWIKEAVVEVLKAVRMEVSERSMGHMAPTVRYLEFWLDDKKINEAPIMREEFVDGEWNWN